MPLHLPAPLDDPVVEHRIVRGFDDGGSGRVRVRQ